MTVNYEEPKGAVLSEDQLYRYRLWRVLREVNEQQTIAFIMLNPSTADGSVDDATLRRCIGYARDWGFDRLEIGNLYGYRTSSPAVLKKSGYLVGEENDEHLARIAARADRVVLAWGTHGKDEQAQHVFDLLRGIKRLIRPAPVHFPSQARGTALYALGFTANGSPVHPLRQRADARPVPMHWLKAGGAS
jgi:hypothetical protein